jgi:hypothetical protein
MASWQHNGHAQGKSASQWVGSWSDSRSSGASSGWDCRVCGTSNWPKHKVCWTCKVQRSYADVAASAIDKKPVVKPAGAGMSLHAQLDALTKQLVSVVSPSAESVVALSQTPVVAVTVVSNKSQFVSQLQQLEASLAALPDCQDFSAVRAQFVSQINDTKSKIYSTKPFGARLDGCRNALERARNRLGTADAAVQAAAVVRETAANQVTKYEAELAELEALISEDVVKKESSSCLTRLQNEMQSVVDEMSRSPHIESDEASLAMQQMSQLFHHLSAIAVKSQTVACQLGPEVKECIMVEANSVEKARLRTLLLQNGTVMAVPTDVAMGGQIPALAAAGA